ncbi:MAG: dTDP-glucose 4,6-dehydratase [Bacteriovoracia bacterium]
MKNIIITGAAGFIGSNFIKKIALAPEAKDKYHFIILDALTYAGVYESIQPDIEQASNLEFHHIDLRSVAELEKFKTMSISGIIHFAAESHVDNSIKNPNIFVETNVLGTLNLLNLALVFQRKDKNFRFLHVSTDEVYGSLKESDPAFTEQNPIQPNSPYSASKASSDLMVRSYFETFGLNAVITRCSNNYGAFQFPEKLIPLMIGRALANQPLPVYGDGRNIRDWIYVDDHNSGVWSAFVKGKSGEVYNFGGNSERRNIDVVKSLLKILNKPESLISYVEDRLGHDWRYAMNSQKAARDLGWHPTVSFEEGLAKTVDWYLHNQRWIELVTQRKAKK